MNKATGFIAGILTAGLFLSGCGNQIPDMTAEEQALVVSYAAEVVERHDSNHPAKLESEAVVEQKKEEKAQKEAEKEQLRQEEEAKAEEEKNTHSTSQMSEQEVALTLDDVIGIDGFAFSYEGYELDDSYPNGGEDTYFVMDATEGEKLLVLRFLAQNLTADEKELPMVTSGIRFKITADGKTQNALTTMLLNDFSNFDGTIPGNGTQELVLICEVPASDVSADIGSIAVIVKNGDKNATISLQ